MGFVIRSFLLAFSQAWSATSQASDWILADAGDACPNGYSKILSFIECQHAVSTVDSQVEFHGRETAKKWPRGCYYCANVRGCEDGAWFNAHKKGKDVAATQAYCKRDGVQGPDVTNPVIFVGDSDIEGWNTNAWLPAPQSYNLGVGGDTCKDVAKLDSQFINEYQPSQAVLVCGENDLHIGASVKTAYKRFKQVVNAFKTAGVPVLYFGTKPERESKKLWKKYRKYDKKIRKWARALAKDASPPLVMIDSYNGFLDLGNPTSLYQRDQLHLSAEGYEYWNTWARLALDDTTGCAEWRSGECIYRFQARRLEMI